MMHPFLPNTSTIRHDVQSGKIVEDSYILFKKRIIEQLLHKALLFDMYIISCAVDVVDKQTRFLSIWKAVLQRQLQECCSRAQTTFHVCKSCSHLCTTDVAAQFIQHAHQKKKHEQVFYRRLQRERK